MAISFERAAVAASQRRWSESQAQRLASELSAITGISVAQTQPTGAYFDRWVAARKRTLAPGTAVLYAGRIGIFKAYLGANRLNAPLADVTPQVVTAFRDAQLSEGKSATTVNLTLTVVGQALSEAVATGVLPSNPCRGLSIRGAKGRSQKRKHFTFEQFRALAKATSGEWRTLVLLYGYTGARRSEAYRMDWRQIDLTRKLVMIERDKNGDEHWIPLHAALATHLAKLPKPHAGLVMPELAKLEERDISWHFRNTLLPKIGIVQAGPDKSEAAVRGKGRKLAAYSVHSLRHSLPTWLNAAGVSELNRMRLIGHESEDVSRGYTHTELKQLAADMAKIPSV